MTFVASCCLSLFPSSHPSFFPLRFSIPLSPLPFTSLLSPSIPLSRFFLCFSIPMSLLPLPPYTFYPSLYSTLHPSLRLCFSTLLPFLPPLYVFLLPSFPSLPSTPLSLLHPPTDKLWVSLAVDPLHLQGATRVSGVRWRAVES